jgi:hypothetical protein
MKMALVLVLLAQKFYIDDPIREDRDRLPIDPPAQIELSGTYDLLMNTFAPPELEEPIPRALNVNTLGEVPDSSWFTNRIGVRPMSIEELIRGPGVGRQPDVSRPLTIISAKHGGITPGFTIRDARDQTFFIKFDPAAHPSLSTGADVISKNFFHAIGYNVPDSYIVYIRPDRFELDPRALVSLPGGKKEPMDRKYLDRMLDDAARIPDGNVRAIASLKVPGMVVGSFRFHGTRPDDPNDIFPHQHRRELRGYRVFCAWLNHDDSRSINTLDAYADGHIVHYLIDFGSTLGSGSDIARNVAPQDPRAGNEYFLDMPTAWKVAHTFGIKDRAWRNVVYPYPNYAEIGRIESTFFEPHEWTPEYPNPAFDRMLADDAFWAAKIVARFSDDAIRALVATGDYLSVEAERYLADTLIERRDKIVSYYFAQVNPLDEFEVEAGTLSFRNLGAAPPGAYLYEWFIFDNETSTLETLGIRGERPDPRVEIPRADAPYLMVRLRTDTETKAVDVFLRKSPDGTDGPDDYEVVGIDREL